MKVLVTGSHGLVGSALVLRLRQAGHEVGCLAHPFEGKLNESGLGGFEAVVHLAGESIVGRWTADKKRKIRESRVEGTRLLSEALSRLARPPRVLVCASAIGFYGNRGDEVLNEQSTAGSDFLSEVCREWERALAPASQAGVRTVSVRFGIILSPAGGALAKMILPFKMGMGGIIGTGRQWMSWVSLEDTVGAIEHTLATPALQGPVNVVAPHPVTNRQFTKILGGALSRPTIFPMPAFMARLAFGEMADALLLSSARVEPVCLARSGYRFRHPELAVALQSLLKVSSC